MNKLKTDNWNNHLIRFVEKDGEWWAVGQDVAKALGYANTAHMFRMVDEKDKGIHKMDTTSDKAKSPNTQEMLILNEFGIYQCVFNSHKPEAREFKRWVYGMIKELRQATGLEGFQVFRMLDKEHQKEAMRNLQKSLKQPVRVDFIKANTIANKAISNKHGYSKMVKKADMTPQMLVEREEVLDDTVELMGVNDKYQLGISVSEQIYKKCM